MTETTDTQRTNEPQNQFPSVAAEFAREWGIDPASIQADASLPEEERVKRAEERARRSIEEARAQDRLARFHADVGQEYRATDWSNPQLAPYLHHSKRVMEWQHGPRGLLITGPTGRGKTRAVCELYRRLAIDEGREVRFFNAVDWFAMLGEEMRYGRDEARHFIARHARYPIFILDDLGQQARANTQREDHAQSWFFRFLDIRRAEGLPIIITTNLSAVEIAATERDKTNVRSDPLILRINDLCDIVNYAK